MVDIVLLIGQLLLIALVYLFLFAAVRSGIGRVAVAGPGRETSLVLKVAEGPRELRNVRVPIAGPVVIGRSPDADIVIADDFISGRHAMVTVAGDKAVVEDLGSTNGTVVNGSSIHSPVSLNAGDSIELGTVVIKVERS